MHYCAHSIGDILPEDTYSMVLGLNDSGLMVGESTQKGFFFELPTGTLYNANSFAFADNNFQSILKITDINNSGVFVGIATVNGVEHGFIGSFVPEPSCTLLLVLSIAFVTVSKPRSLNGRN
jgi:hypothetical protein